MYQGEPGAEFGGRLTPLDAIHPSLRHRFAPEDDEVHGGDLVGVFVLQRVPWFSAYTIIESPRNSSEVEDRGIPSTTSARRTARINLQTAFSFSEILSSNQVASAPSPEPPKTKPRSLTSSLRRVGALMTFRSTKSKARSATLPAARRPSIEVDDWGLANF